MQEFNFHQNTDKLSKMTKYSPILIKKKKKPRTKPYILCYVTI